MSTLVTPATPATATAAPVAAKPLTAIQIIEQELFGFFKQKEQAIANVHAIDGAIQSTQMLLGKLKAEAEKAEAFIKAEAEKAEAEVKKGIALVEKL